MMRIFVVKGLSPKINETHFKKFQAKNIKIHITTAKPRSLQFLEVGHFY